MFSVAIIRPAIGVALFAMSFATHAIDPTLVVERKWYADGRLAEERTYLAGKESGSHRGWWPNGSPRFVYAYREGFLEGESREWFPSGALWRDQLYAQGHESGLQRLYWEDGRVRASYEVRDGRRYGLMGAKGCVTKDSTEVTR